MRFVAGLSPPQIAKQLGKRRGTVSNSAAGAFRAKLFWKTPEIHEKEKIVEKKPKTRSVYLPDWNQWIDFWTGQTISGS